MKHKYRSFKIFGTSGWSLEIQISDACTLEANWVMCLCVPNVCSSRPIYTFGQTFGRCRDSVHLFAISTWLDVRKGERDTGRYPVLSMPSGLYMETVHCSEKDKIIASNKGMKWSCHVLRDPFYFCFVHEVSCEMQGSNDFVGWLAAVCHLSVPCAYWLGLFCIY